MKLAELNQLKHAVDKEAAAKIDALPDNRAFDKVAAHIEAKLHRELDALELVIEIARRFNCLEE